MCYNLVVHFKGAWKHIGEWRIDSWGRSMRYTISSLILEKQLLCKMETDVWFFFPAEFPVKELHKPCNNYDHGKAWICLEFKICFPLAEEGLFCDAGALSGGRKCALYFDVSVSGQTYCLLEQILESYEREGWFINWFISSQLDLTQATRDTMGKLLGTTRVYMRVLGWQNIRWCQYKSWLWNPSPVTEVAT